MTTEDTTEFPTTTPPFVVTSGSHTEALLDKPTMGEQVTEVETETLVTLFGNAKQTMADVRRERTKGTLAALTGNETIEVPVLDFLILVESAGSFATEAAIQVIREAQRRNVDVEGLHDAAEATKKDNEQEQSND